LFFWLRSSGPGHSPIVRENFFDSSGNQAPFSSCGVVNMNILYTGSPGVKVINNENIEKHLVHPAYLTHTSKKVIMKF